MSLINDALRRAGDADRKRRSNPPEMPLQPVEPAGGPNPTARWVVLAVVFVALGFSVWSFSRWALAPPPPARAEPATNPQATPASASAPLYSASDLEPTAPVEGALQTSEANGTAPAAPGTIESPAPTPASAPTVPGVADTNLPGLIEPEPVLAVPAPVIGPPELRLQSIIFRLRNPSVVINGEMLQQGDDILGAKVTDIQRHRVTVQWEDTNIILTLPSI